MNFKSIFEDRRYLIRLGSQPGEGEAKVLVHVKYENPNDPVASRQVDVEFLQDFTFGAVHYPKGSRERINSDRFVQELCDSCCDF